MPLTEQRPVTTASGFTPNLALACLVDLTPNVIGFPNHLVEFIEAIKGYPGISPEFDLPLVFDHVAELENAKTSLCEVGIGHPNMLIHHRENEASCFGG